MIGLSESTKCAQIVKVLTILLFVLVANVLAIYSNSLRTLSGVLYVVENLVVSYILFVDS